uniref:TIL domain-containing protein n=1 Tax=Anopheles atroparvus TaxID=41427 RepID=A0AAG5D4F3_ANOAO
MNIKCLFLMALIFGLFAAVQARAKCKYGERYFCGSTTCEMSCETINYQTACKAPCTDGCYCAPRYVRDSYGNCAPSFICSTSL